MLWLLTKILVPLAAWFAFSIWLAHVNVLAAYCISYGGVLVAIIVFFAYSSYKWKRDLYADRYPSDSLLQQISESAPPNRKPMAAANWKSPVHMPMDYLKPEPRKLLELGGSDNVYVSFTSISVDLQGTAWVDTDTQIYEESRFDLVQVRLIENEGYVLSLPKQERRRFQFTPKRLVSVCSYAPVIQVIEEENDS